MREIKFRAWDKINKRMFCLEKRDDHSFVLFSDGSWRLVYKEERKIVLDSSTGILMQYANLKDKSGNGIYEGDIIRNGLGMVYFVSWHPYGFYFETPYINKSFTLWKLESYEENRCIGPSISTTKEGTTEAQHYKDWAFEIIGNIYENPDLLKDVK